MQNDLLNLVRPEIISMKAYSSARSEASQGQIWMDANENPWNATAYNRYPEPQPNALLAKLSALYNVSREQVLLSRGSDEGIDLLVRLLCRAGEDKIIICPPTYGMYQVAATIQGAGVISVPLVKERHFALDAPAIVAAWKPNVKVVFLCSPNNPTGNLLDESDILFLCGELRGKALVIVDEAYLEFSLRESLARFINDYPNLIILRTLSKAYGLAGVRCGVTLANKALIALLRKMIAPYPIPQPVTSIVLQNLNAEDIKRQVTIILQERERLSQFLETLPFVRKIWKSDANFILFEAHNHAGMLALCFKNGLVLRDRSREPQLADCIRVTVGQPSENNVLMEVLSRA